ncbi:hypothetical protein [Pseudobacteriovorax antillogorgiicola]|uniref:Uncharacterized protein n=1 Tax=Pseudobacteriovorax antillogorgiicola TaxID=1513793 RepID=A0A1Y6BKN9_9BACT|nr:hypothetical protein [Pseudobacteriovorax antillogorgiicola]TCS55403.1 hypothetical protein EDD56_105124 [Pseudobacteriovorax antillogorgiicola]SMF12943.1 hypothetical protein SAMN06296036_105200 [Pseudobacteriovorax antillogorgiicola]
MKAIAATVMATALLLQASAAPHAWSQSKDSQTFGIPGQALQLLPARASNALSGSEFIRSIRHLSGMDRERAIVDQIMAGNFPSFLRDLKPVTYEHRDWKGRTWTLTTYVMPDYLAVGSDRDYVRVPLNLYSAKRITNTFDFMLPTRKMVDTIYHQAEIKLRPRPMAPGPKMTSTQYFTQHNHTIQSQLVRHQDQPGELVAGHKKDVVQTRKLYRKPRAIAIFGWHKLESSRPIQPLSTVHGAGYADYSHGIRMVSNWAFLQMGNHRELVNLNRIISGRYSWRLISDEGRLAAPKKQFTASLQGTSPKS